jgi:hypothetical protein
LTSSHTALILANHFPVIATSTGITIPTTKPGEDYGAQSEPFDPSLDFDFGNVFRSFVFGSFGRCTNSPTSRANLDFVGRTVSVFV